MQCPIKHRVASRPIRLHTRFVCLRLHLLSTVIKLFISDIDGCLAEPYHPYSVAQFQELAELVSAAGALHNNSEQPAFSLCSGRPYPYVEAMTQLLGVQVPVLFESGGGMFDPVAAQVVWNPQFTDLIDAQMQDMRRWLIEECIPGTSMMYDFAKRTQVGIIGPDTEEVYAQVPVVEKFVAEHFPDLRVFHTPVSIDVVAGNITKQQGLHWLGDRLGCPLENMAYIGDSNGDLGALANVGYAFAPTNAAEAVKQQVRVVTDEARIDGVLAAYRWCQAWNLTGTEEMARGS